MTGLDVIHSTWDQPNRNQKSGHAGTSVIILYFMTILLTLPTPSKAKENWGGDTHYFINFHAVAYLPAEMAFFKLQRTIIANKASDSDRDGSPGYYHYIDIDYYPEFFNGTLPHEWEDILALYDESDVRDVGIVPWVIQWWTDSLTVLMENHEWTQAYQIAANIGHYIGDSHQPLHLSLNFDGQNTGNDGIHSRYESQMMSSRLGLIQLPHEAAPYWPNVVEIVFDYIDDIYPIIDLILQSDDSSKLLDPNYGSTYYDAMWTELESVTQIVVQRAIIDLASVWYTAWVNAGKPVPSATADITDKEFAAPAQYVLHQNYPNPYNSSTTLRYSNPVRSKISLRVYNVLGQEVRTLVNSVQSSGTHSTVWDGRDNYSLPVETGIYFARMESGNFASTIKILNLK